MCSRCRQGLGKRCYLFCSCSFGWKILLGDLFLRSAIFGKPHIIFSKLFSFFSLKIYSNHLKVKDYSQKQQQKMLQLTLNLLLLQEKTTSNFTKIVFPPLYLDYITQFIEGKIPRIRSPGVFWGGHSPAMGLDSAVLGFVLVGDVTGVCACKPHKPPILRDRNKQTCLVIQQTCV